MKYTNTVMTMPSETSTNQPWQLSEKVWTFCSDLYDMGEWVYGFDPISLAQMEHVALLNRVDAKFVMTVQQLAEVLASLERDYWILSINDVRLNHYRTLYFDTPDFALYGAHVNNHGERYKVRSREYIDSGKAFLEVKHRTRKGRTIKERIPTDQLAERIGAGQQNWLGGVYPLDVHQLQPTLWNSFTRVTLVNKQCCERVTLDVDIAFSAGKRSAHLDGLAVAEVKMDANNPSSPFVAQMRALKIHQHGFSKYAVGVSMLCDLVKKNAMKPTTLWMKKILKGAVCYE